MIPDKRLGQHFLTDRNILQRIVDALDPAPGDVVLEIGAGTGTLTAVLAPRVRHVIAIEMDRRLAAGMRDAGCEMRDGGRGISHLSSCIPYLASRIPYPDAREARQKNPQLSLVSDFELRVSSLTLSHV